jgi:hypothetical protein
MSVQEDNEPAKLTEEMRAAITPQEPIDEMINPISPEEIQTDYQAASEPKPQQNEKLQDKGYIKTAKSKPKSKPKVKSQFKEILILKSELRKHTESMKRIDTTIKDVQKQFKSLRIRVESEIRNLQRQVYVLSKKIPKGGRSKKSPKNKKHESKMKIRKTKSKGKSRS